MAKMMSSFSIKTVVAEIRETTKYREILPTSGMMIFRRDRLSSIRPSLKCKTQMEKRVDLIADVYKCLICTNVIIYTKVKTENVLNSIDNSQQNHQYYWGDKMGPAYKTSH